MASLFVEATVRVKIALCLQWLILHVKLLSIHSLLYTMMLAMNYR